MSKAKKVLAAVGTALLVLVLGVVLAASLQPSSFRVARSVVVPTVPDAVMPHLVDMEKWNQWNPWNSLDPSLVLTYSENRSGVGAWYAWHGNDKVGSGKMTITGIEENRVRYQIEFIEPFAATNDVVFELTTQGQATRIEWIMTGTNNFVGKMMSVFISMDSMVGADFERGLNNLAQRVQRIE